MEKHRVGVQGAAWGGDRAWVGAEMGLGQGQKFEPGFGDGQEGTHGHQLALCETWQCVARVWRRPYLSQGVA